VGDVDGRAGCHCIVVVEGTAVNRVAGRVVRAGRRGDHRMERRREEDNHRARDGFVVGAVVNPDFVEGGKYYSGLESIVFPGHFVSGRLGIRGIDAGLHHLTQRVNLLEPRNSVHLQAPVRLHSGRNGMDYLPYKDCCHWRLGGRCLLAVCRC